MSHDAIARRRSRGPRRRSRRSSPRSRGPASMTLRRTATCPCRVTIRSEQYITESINVQVTRGLSEFATLEYLTSELVSKFFTGIISSHEATILACTKFRLGPRSNSLGEVKKTTLKKQGTVTIGNAPRSPSAWLMRSSPG